MLRVRSQVNLPMYQIENKTQIAVAVLDSGINYHPDLTDSVVCFRDFVNHRNISYDDYGHGTHVCGIIGGNGKFLQGKYSGMAPQVKLVIGKVLDQEGNGYAEHMLAGIYWVISIRNIYHIRVLNISVGIGDISDSQKITSLKKAIRLAWESGIAVVCAAGNQGPGVDSLSKLGEDTYTICVGCHDGDFFKTYQKRCEIYSGRGYLFASPRKPDLVAPGTSIVSCSYKFPHEQYTTKSGTSMATPIVSGAVALKIMEHPDITNEQLRYDITRTATDLGEPWNKQGWGMLNTNAFLKK